jgi:hypothetical protein
MVARASVVGLLRISPGAFDASASSDRSVEFREWFAASALLSLVLGYRVRVGARNPSRN